MYGRDVEGPQQPFARTRASGTYAVGVGVHDAVTASLAERAGFDLLWLSSLEVSTAKGLPDANIVTYSEVGDVLRDVREATSLPVVVDGDNGYGCTETAVRSALAFAGAGAAAVCIEDNAFPKRNSFYGGVDRALEDVDDFCQRLATVKEAVGERLEVVARTEALVAGLGVDAAVERAERYVDAGADALFVQSRRSTTEQYERVLAEVSTLAPVMATPTSIPETRASALYEQGIDVVVFSNVVIRAIVHAVSGMLTRLRAEERIAAVADEIASLDAVFDLVGTDARLEKTRSDTRSNGDRGPARVYAQL